MRTRRSRGLKQTRKGGDARENFERYKSNWSRQEKYRKYNPKMYYPTPTIFEKLTQREISPKEQVGLDSENTYIFQRHGFSCANLLKANKNKFHFRVPDPSLTAYGILTLLRENKKPEHFDGIVFTSSLVRTVQTALLEYGMHGDLTIIMSPYIKEKNGMIADLANFPLPFDQQIAHMEQFMKFLQGINSDVARAIITNQHTIIFNNKSYTLGPYDLPKSTQRNEKPVYEYPMPEDPAKLDDYTYVTQMKIKMGKPAPAKEESTVTKYAFIPNVSSIPEANYSKYYGPAGFIYFDHWVRRNYPDVKVVFVVSHSNLMQKIIQEYCEVPLVNPIFDENAWKLGIRPKPPSDPVTDYNYIFELYPGIPKPSPDELSRMSLRDEPSCRTAVVEVSNEQDVEAMLERRTEVADHSLTPTFKPTVNPLTQPEVANPFKPTVNPFTQTAATEPSLFLTEVTTVPIQSRDVTSEPKVDMTRSFTELVYMLSNPGIAQGLSLLIDSPKELKTKVLQFVYSNPVVDTRGFFSRPALYLFQNHYFAFILMYNPFYEDLVKRLENGSDMLAHFKITSHPSSVIRFFKQLRTLIDTDAELYQVLVSLFAVNANKQYSLEAPPKVYVFTLLDLLLYEMLPMTVEKIQLMYPLFIDLVRKGARFSSVIYSDNIVAKEVDYPSPDIVPRKMPRSELKQFIEIEQIALKNQWEETSRRLDPKNELSTLNEQFRQAKRRLEDINGKVKRSTQIQQLLEQQSAILDEMFDIKRRYREANTRLDPTQELPKLRVSYREKINEGIYHYLFDHLIEYIPTDDLPIRQAHNAILRKIAGSLGGSRGTSWKKTLLRQSSVKAGRYRASLYKGKRRTRANRS